MSQKKGTGHYVYQVPVRRLERLPVSYEGYATPTVSFGTGEEETNTTKDGLTPSSFRS
jgi:hypothetical protein